MDRFCININRVMPQVEKFQKMEKYTKLLGEKVKSVDLSMNSTALSHVSKSLNVCGDEILFIAEEIDVLGTSLNSIIEIYCATERRIIDGNNVELSNLEGISLSNVANLFIKVKNYDWNNIDFRIGYEILNILKIVYPQTYLILNIPGLREFLDQNKAKFDEIDRLEELRREELYNKVTGGTLNFDSLDSSQKKDIVDYYEKLHPEYKRNMNKLLKVFADEGGKYSDQLLNIKVLAYTANEPARTVFLESADDIKILDIHYTSTANFSSSKGGVSLNADKMSNTAASYSTFFHECGHNIDWIKGGKDNSFFSVDNNLNAVLENEVRSTIEECCDNYLLSNGIDPVSENGSKIKAEVVNEMMNCIDYSKDPGSIKYDCGDANLNPIVKDCFHDVRNVIKNSYKGSKDRSDIYGAFTGNVLRDGLGHDALERTDGVDRVYWLKGEIKTEPDGRQCDLIYVDNGKDGSHETRYVYIERNSDGSVKYGNSASNEFFAENFSADMTRDARALEGNAMRDYNSANPISGYSKEAKNAYENLLQQMVK